MTDFLLGCCIRLPSFSPSVCDCLLVNYCMIVSFLWFHLTFTGSSALWDSAVQLVSVSKTFSTFTFLSQFLFSWTLLKTSHCRGVCKLYRILSFWREGGLLGEGGPIKLWNLCLILIVFMYNKHMFKSNQSSLSSLPLHSLQQFYGYQSLHFQFELRL